METYPQIWRDLNKTGRLSAQGLQSKKKKKEHCLYIYCKKNNSYKHTLTHHHHTTRHTQKDNTTRHHTHNQTVKHAVGKPPHGQSQTPLQNCTRFKTSCLFQICSWWTHKHAFFQYMASQRWWRKVCNTKGPVKPMITQYPSFKATSLDNSMSRNPWPKDYHSFMITFP